MSFVASDGDAEAPGAKSSTSKGSDAKAPNVGDAWTDSRNPVVQRFRGERIEHWSFRQVAKPKTPQTPAKGASSAIDAFLPSSAKRPRESLREADRRTLLRRVAYDLTGLPPSPEHVHAFVDDDSPTAFERVVDRLIASPHFGEHWGRIWLDVVRYSDSNGFDWDEFRPQAWRFRDYVVRSFNRDKSFDRLIREHLAGDELFDDAPKNLEEQDALVATGYLRLGPQDNSAALFNEQPRARAELLFDLVETTGSAFLGITLSCCRCHDHKHDPVLQADYYRLRAFFEGVKYGEHVALDLAPVQESNRRRSEELDRRIQELEKRRDEATKEVRCKLRDEKIGKLGAADRKLLETPSDKVDSKDKEKRDKLAKSVEPKPDEFFKALSKSDQDKVKGFDAQIEALKKLKPKQTTGLIMVDAGGDIPKTPILAQGDYKSPKSNVRPGVFSIYDPNEASLAGCIRKNSSGRRLTLANWIASSNNPLTARVFVNRVWQALFGEGFVSTPDDFGIAGAQPNALELLDRLANDFVADGWAVKRLVRRIVLSSHYRAVAEPPGDVDAARRRIRRMTAEQLRDSLLFVSGLMHPKFGGRPSWPELPPEVLQANPAFLDDNAEKTKGWYPSALPEQFCRSIYLVQKRTLRVPFMEAFDLPENATCCGKRNTSTVSPQALSLMNGSLTQAAAKEFAERIRNRIGDDPRHQIGVAFHLALQREPSPEEFATCRRFLYGRSLPELCRVLFNLNEFAYIE